MKNNQEQEKSNIIQFPGKSAIGNGETQDDMNTVSIAIDSLFPLSSPLYPLFLFDPGRMRTLTLLLSLILDGKTDWNTSSTDQSPAMILKNDLATEAVRKLTISVRYGDGAKIISALIGKEQHHKRRHTENIVVLAAVLYAINGDMDIKLPGGTLREIAFDVFNAVLDNKNALTNFGEREAFLSLYNAVFTYTAIDAPILGKKPSLAVKCALATRNFFMAVKDAKTNGLSGRRLKELAYSKSARARIALVRYQNKLPPELVDALAEDPNPTVRSNIAARLDDEALLGKMSVDEDCLVRGAVAGNSHTSAERLEALAADQDVFVRRRLARNTAITEAAADMLVEDVSLSVRKSLAGNPATSLSVLNRLISDADAGVRNLAIDTKTLITGAL